MENESIKLFVTPIGAFIALSTFIGYRLVKLYHFASLEPNHLDEYSIGVKWKNDKFDALKVVSAKSIRAMGLGLFVPTVVGSLVSIANKTIKSLQQ